MERIIKQLFLLLFLAFLCRASAQQPMLENTAMPSAPTDYLQNLIFWWQMTNSTSPITDSSGNGVSLFLTGATKTNGYFGSATYFTPNDYGQISSDSIFCSCSNFSCCTWLNFTTFASSSNSIIDHSTIPSTNGFSIRFATNGTLVLYVSTAGGLVTYLGTNGLLTNIWYFLTMTYDTTNGLIAYTNGVMDGATPATAYPKISCANTLYVARDFYYGNYTAVTMGVTRAYSVALTTNQINLIYHSNE